MRRLVGGLLVAAAVVLAGQGVARAQGDATYAFYGRHPVNPTAGKGFCYIASPHFHSYGPHEPVVYRQNDEGYYYFVGDPTVYTYRGPKWSYYNHHPIPYSFGGGWCYIDGPHYHFYSPGKTFLPRYRAYSGLYWYVGAFDPLYYRYRTVFYAPTARFYLGLRFWPRPLYFGVRPVWWRQPFYRFTPAIYARWGYRGGRWWRPRGYWGPRYRYYGLGFRSIRYRTGFRVGYGRIRAYRGFRRGFRVGARVGFRGRVRAGIGVRRGFARPGFRGGVRARVGVRRGFGGRARFGGGARFGGRARFGGGARFGGRARFGGGRRSFGGGRRSFGGGRRSFGGGRRGGFGGRRGGFGGRRRR